MGYAVPYRSPVHRGEPGKPKHIKIVGHVGSVWNHRPDPEKQALMNDRYRRGECVDCGKPEHMAGRPRCSDCDMQRTHLEPGLKRKEGRRGRRA